MVSFLGQQRAERCTAMLTQSAWMLPLNMKLSLAGDSQHSKLAAQHYTRPSHRLWIEVFDRLYFLPKGSVLFNVQAFATSLYQGIFQSPVTVTDSPISASLASPASLDRCILSRKTAMGSHHQTHKSHMRPEAAYRACVFQTDENLSSRLSNVQGCVLSKFWLARPGKMAYQLANGLKPARGLPLLYAFRYYEYAEMPGAAL